MSNPYSINPVTTQYYFDEKLGEHGALAHIVLQNILSANPNNYSILGERRFGKTSFLGYLEREAENTNDLIIVSIDLLSLSPQSSAGFYKMLTLALFEAGALDSDEPPLDYMGFFKFLIKLKKAGQRFVLLIDEFDMVARSADFDLAFFNNLRALANKYPLRFVVASVAPLNKIAHSDVLGSPFFNIFIQERLKPLSEKGALELAKNPPGGQGFTDAEAKEIISLAGTHTYFLQLCCSLAWDLREASGGKLDMAELRESFAGRATPQYQYIWDHSSAPERQVLYDLAQGAQPNEQGLKALTTRGYVIDENNPILFSKGFAEFIKQQSVTETPAPAAQPGGQNKGSATEKPQRPLGSAPMPVNPDAKEQRLALIVGVNKYQYEEGGSYVLNPLSYAEQDALELEKVLLASGFTVTKLIGSDATYDAVQKAFKKFHDATQLDPHQDSCFVFHFSGHGQMDPNSKETGYLMLYDTDPDAPSDKGLEMENLVYNLIAQVKVPSSLMLLDCCHAGFAAGVKNLIPVRDRLHNLTQQIFADVRGRLVLGACAGNYVARELKDLSHGIFTYYVLKHWRDQDGWTPPNPITNLSLASYVMATMPQNYPKLPKPIWGGAGVGSLILRKMA